MAKERMKVNPLYNKTKMRRESEWRSWMSRLLAVVNVDLSPP
jgi:hypothetical protein